MSEVSIRCEVTPKICHLDLRLSATQVYLSLGQDEKGDAGVLSPLRLLGYHTNLRQS